MGKAGGRRVGKKCVGSNVVRPTKAARYNAPEVEMSPRRGMANVNAKAVMATVGRGKYSVVQGKSSRQKVGSTVGGWGLW